MCNDAVSRPADVSVLGLGYVGLPLAIAFCDAGLSVIGVETDPGRRTRLGSGVRIHEPGLEQRLAAHLAAGQFRIVPHPEECPAHVICVGTDIDEQTGQTSLMDLQTAAEAVADVLRDDDLVLLRSTVSVGTTRNFIDPILAKAGRRHLLAACPERTIEGAALAELRSLPQIVGGLGPDASARAAALFGRITDQIVQVASPEAAEITKLVNNSLRDLVFAFANEVAVLCDAAGVDVTEVIDASNRGYPRSGLSLPGPVGGPCLSKDPIILAESARALGAPLRLSTVGRSVNANVPEVAVASIARALASGPQPRRIVIAGLAFKGRPEVADVRATPALLLKNALAERFPDAAICGVDPLVPVDVAEARLGIPVSGDFEKACIGADILIFQTNHAGFQALDLAAMAHRMTSGGIIYDFWRQFARTAQLPNGVVYLAFGRGSSSNSA